MQSHREEKDGPAERDAPLLVLGGGICGLAAAHEAGLQGVPVVVVEKQPTFGGLLRTDQRDGFRFDRGGHRFITALPWVLERVRALLGDRLQVRQRRSLVMLDGTAVEYPLQVGDLLRRLGLVRNARALGSWLVGRWSARGAPEHTLEQWLRRRFGDYLYRTVFAGYSEKLWGTHPRHISAEWAPERISIPGLGGFLRELAWPSRRPARTYARRYLYPRHGIGEIPAAFAREIVRLGGDLRPGCHALRLRKSDGHWHVDLSDGSVLRARAIIATIPPPALDAILELPDKPPVPELRFRALRFLNLGFSHPVPLDTTWLYQPDPACRFTRVQVPAARSAEMVPPGCGSFQFEEPLAPEQAAALSGSEKQLRLSEALALLRGLGFKIDAPILRFDSYEPHAYPVYERGQRQRVAQWQRALGAHAGLAVTGRQGGFSFIFLDRAIAEGANACRRLLGLAEHAVEHTVANRPLPLEAASLVEEWPVAPQRRPLEGAT